MQHHIVLSITVKNEGFNNYQEQLLSLWNPGRVVQAICDGSTNIQGSTQNIRGTNSFITRRNPSDTK